MKALRFCLAIVLVACLGACSRALFDTPQPPSAPLPADVIQVKKEVDDAFSAAGQSQTPQEYTAAGYFRVEQKCNDFFDQLTLYKGNSSFWSTQIATAGATAAGMLALLAASTTAIGIVGLGAGLAAATITNFQNFAMATPYPLETRQLVFAALSTARTSKPPNEIVDIYDARSTVAAYAQYCTYSGIATLSQQALQSGADKTIDANAVAVPDVLRLSIATLAGGALSDSQLALVLILQDSSLTAAQRSAAIKMAAFSAAQAGVLLNGTVLSESGRAVARIAASTAASRPAFAAIVVDLRTKVKSGLEAAPVLEMVVPAAPVIRAGPSSAPLPTPRVIVR